MLFYGGCYIAEEKGYHFMTLDLKVIGKNHFQWLENSVAISVEFLKELIWMKNIITSLIGANETHFIYI